MGDFNDAIEKALKSPQDMDAYLEVRSAQEVIDDILALKRPSPDRSEARERMLPIDDDSRDHCNSTLPAAMIIAGSDALEKCHDDLRNYVSGKTTDWDSGMIAVAVYRAMTKAAGLVPDEAKIRADERRIPVVLFDEIAAAVQVLADTPVSEWNSKAELQSFFRGVAEKFGEVILDRNSPAVRNAT